MKRVGNLFEKIVAIDNIKKAILFASKGKKDRRSVQNVNNALDKHAKHIQDMLVNKTYVPSPYIEMTIHDRNTKKGKSNL